MEGKGNSNITNANKSSWTQVAAANADGWTTVTNKSEKKKIPKKKKEVKSTHASKEIETTNNWEPKKESEKIASLEEIASKSAARFLGKIPKFAEEIKKKSPHLDDMIVSNISPFDLSSWWTIYSDPTRRRQCNYWKYLQMIEQYEAGVLQLEYGTSSSENVLNKVQLMATPTNKNIKPQLINVYENYDTFFLEPSNPNDKHARLCFAKHRPYRPPPNSDEKIHSVVDRDEFLTHFHIFTNDQLADWKDWSNMAVVGGAVSAALMKVPQKFSGSNADVATFYHDIGNTQSDIDIYIFGLSESAFISKVKRLYEHLGRIHGKVLVVRTIYTLTFCTEYPSRHIQIVLGKWKTLEHVLCESDVDCSAVAFDGTNVWASHRARLSYNTRTIVSSPARYSVRDCPQYETRLIKYSKRGFYITDDKFIWTNLSRRWLQIGYDRLKYVKTFSTRSGVTGLRFLIVVHKHPELNEQIDVLKDLNTKFPKKGLLYGPFYSMQYLEKKLHQKVKIMTSYGPWEVDNPYQIVNIYNTEFKFKPLIDARFSSSNWYSHILYEDEVAERKMLREEALEYKKNHGKIPEYLEYLYLKEKKKKNDTHK